VWIALYSYSIQRSNGGSQSEEFMVETQSGEDSVVLSEDGTYASNLVGIVCRTG
jgi:prolyl-tRNA synthetase